MVIDVHEVGCQGQGEMGIHTVHIILFCTHEYTCISLLWIAVKVTHPSIRWRANRHFSIEHFSGYRAKHLLALKQINYFCICYKKDKIVVEGSSSVPTYSGTDGSLNKLYFKSVCRSVGKNLSA